MGFGLGFAGSIKKCPAVRISFPMIARYLSLDRSLMPAFRVNLSLAMSNLIFITGLFMDVSRCELLIFTYPSIGPSPIFLASLESRLVLSDPVSIFALIQNA